MEKERGKRGAESLPRKRAGSPAPSCVSMKSDKSMGLPPKFSMEPFPPDQSLPRKRAGSPAPSCVSMKSDKSMGLPPKFSEEPFPPDQRDQVERCNSDPHEGDLSSVFKFPEEKAQMLLNDDPADRLEQRHLLSQCQRRMKCDLKKKCECVFEGKAKEGQPTLLSEIYTELYITEGGTGEVNDEHEVRQIETASKKRVTEDTTVKCNDIFKPLCGRETPIRTVLTKGVAGIGKTVSVQKFILDWAEGKANQDVHFIFALPFRNLNLIKDEYSLIELLHHFVPELKSFEPSELFMYKVLFIFDGLDECRLPLDFQNNESWFDVTKRMSLDVLLTNLIKGNLLPSALLWITSRPAAANQIPAKCVHQVTEIRGFSDAQKEEYFRRRFNDQSLASRIISHVKSSRSLFIMCHIPVFCWMSATVLERLFSETDSGEIPKTLTEMYTHFLIFQTTLKNVKYMKNHETKLNEYSKEFLLKLGKLAFDNLEKGNLIFYEQDLSENGIDVTETSVYSGVCTEVFKEEYGLYQEKVYCFVHLSIQEYLAALYVFLSNTSPDLLETAVDQALESKNGHLDLYLRFLLGLSTDSSQNLLQWLLGQTRINSRNVEEMHRYMHPSSFCTPRSALWEFEADFHRRMSRLFLSELGSNPKRDANPFLAQYIKHKIQENLSPERTINLFHCLNELGDNSLVEEVQRYLNSGRLSAEGLSPAQYSALAFVLLMSDEELDVFDMKKFVRSDKEHWRLLPVVKTSKTALLNGCNLTEKCCEALASALRSNSSALRELDLSDNDLSDHVLSDNDPNVYHQQILKLMLMFHRQIGKLGKNSGVKLLSAGLGDSHCKLEILRLSGCRVREEGCSSLASALRSNPSHLRELDLSYNHPGDSGVKLLSAVLEDPSCKLEKLKLVRCGVTKRGCSSLASALRSNPSHLRELDLSYNHPGDSGVKLLSAVLKDPSCKLEKLKLVRCGVTKRGCSSLASALRSNPSHLRELDLSKTHTGDSGVKLLSAVLEDPSCKLEKLMLSWCGITEEGCSSLASALRSNPSHLRELDLSLNNPGDSGVMLLSAVLEDPSCKLEKLNGLMERADSPVPSCVSMKSDQSMEPPRNLSDGPFPPDQSGLMERAGSPVPSCVSMKSDQSMEPPRNLSDGPFPPDQRDQVKRCNSDPHEGDLSSVFKFPEEKAHMFLNDDPADRLEQSKSPHLLSHCQHRIKHNLKKKCECVFEGKAKEGRPTLLSEIYTELYITEGGTGGVNDEHEVRQIETASKKRVTRDTTVKCNDIIKPLCGRETPIRTVLTKGVAGIGKTVSVQKFILDWAEGKANQDVHFIFALPFRNLNLIKDEYSLIELLHHFVPELKSFEPSELFMYKVLFIFDGLDECRLPLDFQNNESWFDVTKKMSLDVLLTNLIKGNLLPSALLWITSRPAAASQIPAKCVHQVTEIRGFSDAQKEEYFRRRFNDQSLASRIISHVKSSRSLFIMCHIPVFCWMSATVLERLFSETDSGEIPKTLTEMYTHFLIFQTTLKNDKYMKNHETKLNEYSKKFLLKLGKLAFDNLEKGNLIFYEQDLTENDIDVTEASVYSGVCTEVFKEEYGLYQEKVYCFVHLSIQEYLAALYVFLSNTSPDLLETVVDEALESKNGHLDLYLRFLLGLSTDSNQNLLQRLLGQTRTSSHNLEETVKYIKENVQENLSTERTINLFHCLNELGDNSLVEEVQRFLNSERLSAEGLSPAQYSALAFVLLMSDEELDVFDLKKFVRSDKEHWRLLPVVKTSKTALLNSCDLTGECCEELASALRSNSSPLRELDLSDNDLSDHVLQDPGGKPHFARQRDFHRKLDKDSEEKLLSAGLGNSHCKQEILRLNGCDLTEKCCEALASGLRSNSSPLSDNDLSVNDQQDSGVKLLSAGLADSHCKLEILRLSGCRVREEGCSFLASALRSNPSHLRELDLSYNHPGDSGVKLLSAVLEDPSCKLEKLKLDRCELTEKCCEALASALRSNSSPLRELDLSDNDLQESGVKLLSAGLGDSHCKLEILRLSGCRVTEEGCSSLASALRSNPSHLRELDLSYNHPGDSGVKLLSAVLEDPSCKLEKLNVDQSGECRIRPGFLKYSCHLTLDPNTAHRCLSLSEGNRKVQWVEEEPYPDHPERFDRWKQVLCRESLTGRCYWEAEWWGADPRIGVTYKGIRRKGESDDCGLGFNEKSWILSRHNLPSIYFVQHNNKRTDLPRDTPIPPRVGVYLDWEAGTLCFYSVFSDGLTLLHRFTSTFTEPLCPGLAIGANRPGFEDHHPYGVLSLRTLE
ncbi:uncharacterized protein LOC125749639 isoform X21 [Brienomyrus brachyistius]|uniref:uncharacterized protein LOC125749639 isoform X21 n=1 Tax=Brienomyrus brachyistius TaxID=42636 RepID=UPI0020B2D2A5|nr:uncharacterized protein LOC125749639 isoform X21 [Brienomyrus brachyistius]